MRDRLWCGALLLPMRSIVEAGAPHEPPRYRIRRREGSGGSPTDSDRHGAVALVSVCIALSACTNAGSELPMKPAAQPTPAEDSAMPHDRRSPAPLLEKVLEDAQQRTGVSRSQLEIMSIEKVTWNDGALGCPQAGRMYTQALAPGYRIVVRTSDQTLNYHAAETGRFVLCAPQAPENTDVR